MRTRDPDALQCIWTRTNEWCYTSVRRYCNDESVALSAAIKTFEKILGRFEQYELKGSFFGFCRTICVREVIDQCRHKSRGDISYDEIEELGSAEIDPSGRIGENEILKGLQPCWNELTNSEQQVLELRYLTEHPVGSGEYGMLPADVAEIMGITQTHVNKIACVARQKLLTCLKKHGFGHIDDFLASFG